VAKGRSVISDQFSCFDSMVPQRPGREARKKSIAFALTNVLASET
jgi:hypothetical protein